MNAIASDNMRYSGSVEVKLRIGNKVVTKQLHNQGTMQLKRAFAMFMCGGKTTTQALNYLPSKLDLRYSTDNWETEDTFLKRIVPVTSPFYAKDTSSTEPTWYVEYTAVIPYAQLIEGIKAQYSYRIYLMCEKIEPDDESNDLAFIDLDTNDLLSVGAGVSIILN